MLCEIFGPVCAHKNNDHQHVDMKEDGSLIKREMELIAFRFCPLRLTHFFARRACSTEGEEVKMELLPI